MFSALLIQSVAPTSRLFLSREYSATVISIANHHAGSTVSQLPNLNILFYPFFSVFNRPRTTDCGGYPNISHKSFLSVRSVSSGIKPGIVTSGGSGFSSSVLLLTPLAYRSCQLLPNLCIFMFAIPSAFKVIYSHSSE